MKKIVHLLLGMSLLLTLVSCGGLGLFSSSNNLASTNLEKLTPLAELRKGPCFGQCPVFTMVVYDNGIVTYEGKQHTRQGMYIQKISDGDLKDLKTTLEAAKLWEFKDAYRGRIPDLPPVTVVHHKDGQQKKVIGKDGRPEKVMNVQAALEKIENTNGWQLQDGGEKKSDLPDHIVGSEMRVRVHDNVDIYVWARKYRKYGMKVINPISASTNYWLVGYNAQKNDPKEVLAIVQADLQVLDAEFNRQATN